jgi:iron complex transport system ATP-binding protein
VPIGSGNLVNLELASEALKRGKTVLLSSGMADRDYTDGMAALKLVTGLLKNGAFSWQSIQELMLHLQRHSQN